MESKKLIIRSSMKLLSAVVGGSILLTGCISSDEDEPMLPGTKIVKASPDSKAMEAASPNLTPAAPSLTTAPAAPVIDPVPVYKAPVQKKSSSTVKPVKVSKGSAKAQTYIIQKGDSYWKVAKKFGVSVKELQAANPKVPANKFYVGKKLVIPAGAAYTATKTAAVKKAAAKSAKTTVKKSAAKEQLNGDVYVVKAGDSYWKIAKKFGVSGVAIAEANNLPLTKPLQAGQKLKIPAAASKKTAAKPAAKKTAPVTSAADSALPDAPAVDAPAAPAAPAASTDPAAPAAAPVAPAAVPEAPVAPLPEAEAAPAAKGSLHKLDKDASLEELAQQFGTTVSELKKLNPQLKENTVKAGTDIKLP